MRGLLSSLKGVFKRGESFSFDENGAYRSWKYDPENDEEAEAIQSFVEYLNSHGIKRNLEVFTKNEEIWFTHSRVIGGLQNDRFTHYLVYPDWSESKDYNRYTDQRSGVDWRVSFRKTKNLDPEYHNTCPFGHTGTCDYCTGPNKNEIG